MLLSIKIIKKSKVKGPFYALNDVVVTRGSFANVINLDIYVGKNYTTTYQADGIIISTPTGSTAICLSAGGPIVHPKMEAFVILPICPHTLSNRPLVLPTDSEISVQIKPSRPTEKNFILSIDGQEEYEIDDGDKINVTKAVQSLKVVTLPHEDYFKILRTKLKWGGINDI
jgi:NAD+ kinase